VDVLRLYGIRDQLWAEAVVRYRAGENWHLHEPELVAEASDEQADRQPEDVWDGIIGQYLQNSAVATSGVTISQILAGAIGKAQQDWTHSDKIRVGACLKRLHWVKGKQRRNGGKPERPYFPDPDRGGITDDPHEDVDPRD
jgi:predicted P-loop ATPase